MNEKDPRYSYERFGSKGSRVGQAVVDILSGDMAPQTVEETMEAMTPKYFQELMMAAERGGRFHESPYYVVVVRKKETLAGMADNILSHKYIDRQTKPTPEYMRYNFPNHDHDVYEVDGKNSSITHLWTLPTKQDSATIVKNKSMYDPQLVKWIMNFDQGKLS
jgi:hypothetical protein